MKINVKHVAKLANLPLSSDEEEKYSKQLSEILEYVDQLNEVNTSSVEPTYNVTGLNNVTREDVPIPSNASQKKNAVPAGRQGFFVTKGIFDNE